METPDIETEIRNRIAELTKQRTKILLAATTELESDLKDLKEAQSDAERLAWFNSAATLVDAVRRDVTKLGDAVAVLSDHVASNSGTAAEVEEPSDVANHVDEEVEV